MNETATPTPAATTPVLGTPSTSLAIRVLKKKPIWCSALPVKKPIWCSALGAPKEGRGWLITADTQFHKLTLNAAFRAV